MVKKFEDEILNQAEKISNSDKPLTTKKYVECVKLLEKKMWINEKENILMKALQRLLYKKLGGDAVLVPDKYKPKVI